jgi:hypothetical protein
MTRRLLFVWLNLLYNDCCVLVYKSIIVFYSIQNIFVFCFYQGRKCEYDFNF